MLRPVDSVDGMTAQSVPMTAELLRRRCATELLAIDGIAGVFYDLTHKPPGHDRVGVSRYPAATSTAGSFTSSPDSRFNRSVSSRSTSDTDA